MKEKRNCLKSVAVTIYVIAALIFSGCQDDQFIPDLEKEKPNLQTSAASEVKDLSATLNANILDNGGAAISDRGFYLGTQSDPKSGLRIAGSSQGSSFSAPASSLIPQTTYYVQAYATNSVGTGYGQVISFVTSKTPVQVKAGALPNWVNSTFTEAVLEGRIVDPGTVSIQKKGFWVSSDEKLSKKKDISVSGEKFQANINGLQKDAKYFFCAYVQTELGLTSSDTLSFRTAVFQLEGDYYHSVIIGSQEWLVENLHVTKFRNGEAIPNVKENQAWAALTTPAYCAYENNEAIADTCGYLYNQFVVLDPRGLGPEGWRAPSYDDMLDMFYHLEGSSYYYMAMSLMNMTGWQNLPSQEERNQPTNSTGFSAKPSGGRRYDFERSAEVFVRLGSGFAMWSTFFNSFGGRKMEIISELPLPGLGGETYQQDGLSVRLVRQN